MAWNALWNFIHIDIFCCTFRLNKSIVDPIEIIGLMAATLTTSAFVPQVYKAWRHRSTKDISLVMYIAFFVGTLLWLYYGLVHKSLAIILANGVTCFLVGVMLFLKLRFK